MGNQPLGEAIPTEYEECHLVRQQPAKKQIIRGNPQGWKRSQKSTSTDADSGSLHTFVSTPAASGSLYISLLCRPGLAVGKHQEGHWLSTAASRMKVSVSAQQQASALPQAVCAVNLFYLYFVSY